MTRASGRQHCLQTRDRDKHYPLSFVKVYPGPGSWSSLGGHAGLSLTLLYLLPCICSHEYIFLLPLHFSPALKGEVPRADGGQYG